MTYSADTFRRKCRAKADQRRSPTNGDSMKLIRAGNIWMNPEHIVLICPKLDQYYEPLPLGTTVFFTAGPTLTFNDATTKSVADLLNGEAATDNPT